jgi:hypothetical protein
MFIMSQQWTCSVTAYHCTPQDCVLQRLAHRFLHFVTNTKIHNVKPQTIAILQTFLNSAGKTVVKDWTAMSFTTCVSEPKFSTLTQFAYLSHKLALWSNTIVFHPLLELEIEK